MLVFQVRSSSDADTQYTVTAALHPPAPGEWECECAGYYYRDTCRHIEACKDALIAGIESISWRYESSPEDITNGVPND